MRNDMCGVSRAFSATPESFLCICNFKHCHARWNVIQMTKPLIQTGIIVAIQIYAGLVGINLFVLHVYCSVYNMLLYKRYVVKHVSDSSRLTSSPQGGPETYNPRFNWQACHAN